MSRQNHLLEQWKNPPSEYRGKPFWSWNGKLERAELLRQIDVMREMGFGGYFMHSRTGLQTEYLGEEWFQLIRSCAEYGAEQGLEGWLYDEDRWPSGTAGGMVTEQKAHRMKFIEMILSEGEWFDGTDLAAFACVLTESGFSGLRRLTAGDRLADGETALRFRITEMRSTSFYNGNTYLDTMSREAVRAFLDATHEKYLAACGGLFGGPIQGVFTDEPHRGALFSSFSEGSPAKVPYTEGLFERFEKKYGSDLTAQLPELFLTRDVRPVKWQFVELEQELFLENYVGQIGSWCRENRLKLTGHMLHEDSLTTQTAMQGSLMRSYALMEIPGVDVLSEHNQNYWIVKQLTSVARQTGKKWELSELYGCTGWQFSFQGHKEVGDWQALFGINLRCHHLSWYTMEGEAKRDYPASILHQSAWHPEYRYVESYFARLGMLLSAGRPDCELLVLNPVESVWARVYSGCFQGLNAADPRILELEAWYSQVFHLLAGNRIDFDYGDEGLLAELASVEDGILRVGEMRYRTVLVTGMDTMRRSTLDLLRRFQAAGGRVLLAGGTPGYLDAVPCAEDEFQGMRRIAVEEIPAFAASGREIQVRTEKEVPVFSQTRILEQGRAVVLMNMDRERAAGAAEVCLGPCRSALELDARSGEARAAELRFEEGKAWAATSLDISQERVFLAMDTPVDAGMPPSKGSGELLDFQPQGYTLDEPNVCVLDTVQVRVDDGEWSGPMEILKADQQVRDHFGLPRRGGAMVQPWYSRARGGQSSQALGRVSLRFRVEAEVLPDTPVELVLERCRDFRVSVNGRALDLSRPAGRWIDICFDRFELPAGMLQRGENVIELEADFRQELGLEAVYLLGSFGVRLDGIRRVLTALPDRLRLGDITCQGLPFYSGRVTYRMTVPQWKRCSIRADLKSFEGACASVNGSIAAFRPYTALAQTGADGEIDITVVLTRRNTFGPLHQLPLRAGSYGAENFITTGGQFSLECQLIEQGLMETPVLERMA